MINEKKVKRYCSEDLSKIENYDKAVADNTQTWHCHHRRETVLSREELIEIGEYYDRPARELVFLTEVEHKSLHKNHLGHKHSPETKLRMLLSKCGKPSNRKGTHHTKESKMKISIGLSGRHLSEEHKAKLRNKIWANNGVISKMFDPDCVPNGWTLGRIRWKISP